MVEVNLEGNYCRFYHRLRAELKKTGHLSISIDTHCGPMYLWAKALNAIPLEDWVRILTNHNFLSYNRNWRPPHHFCPLPDVVLEAVWTELNDQG